MKSKIILQGSAEWHKARLGNFSSSEIYRLMTKAGSEGLSVGAKTYCDEKLDEIMTGQEKTFKNDFMEYGNHTEELARQAIEAKYGTETMICGLLYHETIPHYCGSLDGVIIINDLRYAIEIKCPFYPKEHRNNIKLSEDIDIFKQKAPDYYYQCQSNIEIGKCDRALFATFNPLFGDLSLVCVEIDRNESDIILMKNKICTGWQYIEMEAETFGIQLPPSKIIN